MFCVPDAIVNKDRSPWHFRKVNNALSISLVSKPGIGAIIGGLTAMWLGSDNGHGGEGIVLWILIGVFIMVPVTYSEILFTQVTKLNPRQFISSHINK